MVKNYLIFDIRSLLNWKEAFDLSEPGSLNNDKKARYENEEKIEVVIDLLSQLDGSEKERIFAANLKFKYWNGAPYQKLFGFLIR